MDAVKLGGRVISGYGVVFTKPEDTDLQGDYFTRETNLWLEHYPEVPVLYQHGGDPKLGKRVIGKARPRVDERGVWYEAQLALRDDYESAIMELIQEGKLGYSTGSLPHLVERASDGKLLSWPVAEITLTPTPAAGPYLTSVSAARSAYKSAGISEEVLTEQEDSMEQEQVKAMIDEAVKSVPRGLTAEDVQGLLADAPRGPGEDDVKAWIGAAVAQAIEPLTKPQPSAPPAETKADDGIKAVTHLRFGEVPAAVQQIARELYGGQYEAQRYHQHQAFAKYMRFGKHRLSADEMRAAKTVTLTPAQIKAYVTEGGDLASLKQEMSSAVDSLGGYLVPEDMRMETIERLPGLTAIRSGADVSATSSDVMTRVVVTGGNDQYVGATRVTWVGDSPAQDDARTRPTFGVERTPVHITLATIMVPRVLLEDSAWPLTAKLSEWLSMDFASDEDEQFLVGDGVAKPQGILPGGANGLDLTAVNSGHATELRLTGLIALRYGIARQYRSRAVWIMNDDTAGLISQMVDGQGRPLWEMSVQAGEPDRLLGYPVLTSEAMPDVAADAFPIIFGDRFGYQIADRIGMSVMRDDTTFAEEDLVRFVFRRRLGGQVNRPWAFAVQRISA